MSTLPGGSIHPYVWGYGTITVIFPFSVVRAMPYILCQHAHFPASILPFLSIFLSWQLGVLRDKLGSWEMCLGPGPHARLVCGVKITQLINALVVDFTHLGL